ncbi:MAG: hypothetical protein A3F46_00450 [Legionellales bacterium RIFCSPHIGHO2_12_FULL_42_9]|nr:MAG: hypothetical protein A3F46_00450 [Legionellales bacterium RIFCSPHIGHO2_12_FULL_42_9]
MMPILNPIHALPKNQVLNKLIEHYNLLPHDNTIKRKASLTAIVSHLQTHPHATHKALAIWINELHDHLRYYQMKTLLPSTQFKTEYHQQQLEKNTPEPSPKPNTKR